MGVAPENITVIPNGADILPTPPRPIHAPPRYLIYFGALQPWQGVDVLLRAFALLADYTDLWLVMCISNPPRSARDYRKLADKLGISDRMLWLFELPQDELAPWRAHALLSVAPLTESVRNVEQGCCPLKILESMAAGVPLISGAITQWEGQVSLFDPAKGGPCYACVFPVKPAPGLVPTCAEAGVAAP
ncbi:MAG: glycosyltransferase, partial [Chloroflexaceae bacterium]|nr:glycosyltransferase [Chloroflexaceae bacterium]